MYSKAHQLLGAWDESRSATPQNASRASSLRLRSATISRKSSMASIEHSLKKPAEPTQPSSKGGSLRKLLHSRSALMLGIKNRKDRNVETPQPQQGLHNAFQQWSPTGNAFHSHTPSAQLLSSRNSMSQTSAFHLPFRQSESSQTSRPPSQSSHLNDAPPHNVQPEPSVIKNKKNLAIHPARLSMLSNQGRRSPLLDTPILDTMFQPSELQDKKRAVYGSSWLASRSTSRHRAPSSLKGFYRAEEDAHRRTESRDTCGRMLHSNKRESYDPRTGYFHGFDGQSDKMDDDQPAAIGIAYGYDGDDTSEGYNSPSGYRNAFESGVHAITTENEPSNISPPKPKHPHQRFMQWRDDYTTDETARPSRAPSHVFDDATKKPRDATFERVAYHQHRKQQMLQQSQTADHSMTMLTMSDSEDSEPDIVERKPHFADAKPQMDDLQETEEFVEENSLQSLYAHTRDGSYEGPPAFTSTFTSSRSTKSNFDDHESTMYASDDQMNSDRTSITSTDSLVPQPLAAASTKSPTSRASRRSLHAEKKERRQERASRRRSPRHPADEEVLDSYQQTMAVTADEYALISNLRRKRAAMQKQMLKEGYRTAMKEQMAKWEDIRQRALNEPDPAAEAENLEKANRKRLAQRPSLPSSPKRRAFHPRHGTADDVPLMRKRAKSNDDIPDLPLNRPSTGEEQSSSVVKSEGFFKTAEEIEPVASVAPVEELSTLDEELEELEIQAHVEAGVEEFPEEIRTTNPAAISTPNQKPAKIIHPVSPPVPTKQAPSSPEDVMRASWAQVNQELVRKNFTPTRSPNLSRQTSRNVVPRLSKTSLHSRTSSDRFEPSSQSSVRDDGSGESSAETDSTKYSSKPPTDVAKIQKLLSKSSTEIAVVQVAPSTRASSSDDVNGSVEGSSTSAAAASLMPKTPTRGSSPRPDEKRTTMIYSPTEAKKEPHSVDSEPADLHNEPRESIDEDEMLLMLDTAVSKTENKSVVTTHIPEKENRVAGNAISYSASPSRNLHEQRLPKLETRSAASLQERAASQSHSPARRVVTTSSPSAPPKSDLPIPVAKELPARSASAASHHAAALPARMNTYINFSTRTPPRSRQHSITGSVNSSRLPSISSSSNSSTGTVVAATSQMLSNEGEDTSSHPDEQRSRQAPASSRIPRSSHSQQSSTGHAPVQMQIQASAFSFSRPRPSRQSSPGPAQGHVVTEHTRSKTPPSSAGGSEPGSPVSPRRISSKHSHTSSTSSSRHYSHQPQAVAPQQQQHSRIPSRNGQTPKIFSLPSGGRRSRTGSTSKSAAADDVMKAWDGLGGAKTTVVNATLAEEEGDSLFF